MIQCYRALAQARFLSVLGMFGITLVCRNAAAQLPDIALNQIPAATVAAFFANDAGSALRKIEEIELVRALYDEPFRAFREAAATKGLSPGSLLDEMPLPWNDVRPLLEGRMAVVAAVQTAPDQVSLGVFVNTSDRQTQWNSLIESFAKSSKASDAKVSRRENADGLLRWIIRSSDGSESKLIVVYQDWILFASEEALIEAWLGAKRMEDDARIENTLKNLQRATGNGSDAWFFADPITLAAIFERRNDAEVVQQYGTFAERHGFDRIKALGGHIKLLDGPYNLIWHVKVWIGEAPLKHGMKLFSWLPSKKSIASDWVPAEVTSHTLMAWDLEPLVEYVGPIVDEAIRDTTGRSENSFDSILAGIKRDCGVDVKVDLFPLLGPRVESFGIVKEIGNKRVEQSVLGIRIVNPEASGEVADILFDFFDGDPTCSLIPVGPAKELELWKLGQGQRAGQIQFKTPGAMVAHGYLFFASNFRAIADYIATPGIDRLNKQAEYARVAKILDETVGPNPAIRIVSFPSREFKNVYELLRAGRTKGAESIYAQLAQVLIESSDTKLPYNLLPPFQAIENTLGLTGIQLDVVDDDWELTGMNLNVPPVNPQPSR